MKRAHRVMCGLAVMMTSVWVGAAAAQTSSASPELSESTKVWITTSDGRQHEGFAVSSNSTQFTLRTLTGNTRIAWTDISRIERADRLWNGALLGAVPGAVLMGLAGKASCTDCASNSPTGTSTASVVVVYSLLGAAAGAGIGALVDWAGGRRLVYSASTPARASVGPVIGSSRLGLGMTLAWGAAPQPGLDRRR